LSHITRTWMVCTILGALLSAAPHDRLLADQAVVPPLGMAGGPANPAETVSESVPNEVALRNAIKVHARTLLLQGDTATFDRETVALRTSGVRTPAGAWKIYYYYHCLDDPNPTNPANPTWSELQSTTADWLSRQPDSPAAVIMSANALLQHGWAYRGGGYVRGVNAASWQPYRELLEQAREIMDTHQSVALKDPEWYALRIDIAKQQGARGAEILDRASQGLARNPYYYPIHYSAVEALLPKWGGSEELIKQYTTLAVDRSREKEGAQAYARIYVFLARNAADPEEALNLYGADEPPMKRSLDEILRAYPDDFNRNSARGIYCFGGFKNDYMALGRRTSSDNFSVAWWDSPVWRRHCDEWAYEGKLGKFTLSSRLHQYSSFLRGFGSPTWHVVTFVSLALLILVQVIVAHQRNAPDRPWTESLRLSASLDPSRYPRTYWIVSKASAISQSTIVRLLVLSSAIAWMLSTIPWSGAPDIIGVFSACIGVALISATLLLQRLFSRIVLLADAIEYRRPFSRRRLGRDAITSWTSFSSTQNGGSQFLRLNTVNGEVFDVPTVRRRDEAFNQWFVSLPGRIVSEAPSNAAGTV
jgi:hypothetical protein